MHCTGYIQQEDYFLSSLTVREHLRYHAKEGFEQNLFVQILQSDKPLNLS